MLKILPANLSQVVESRMKQALNRHGTRATSEEVSELIGASFKGNPNGLSVFDTGTHMLKSEASLGPSLASTIVN